MNRRSFLQAGIGCLAFSYRMVGQATQAVQASAPKILDDLLETVREEHKLPGIAAAAVRGGQIVAEGVAGLRELGKKDMIRREDRFALGSCTKRMTLLMITRLVDSGKLAFESTIAEVLPDIKMRDDYRKVTVAQLLTFTGGIRPYDQIGPRRTPILFEKGPLPERRARFVEHVLQEEPVGKPGTARYSNASYVLVAFLAERQCKSAYESLMAEYVFKPLGMKRAGFGSPRSKERLNEPWLHIRGSQGYQPEPAREGLAEEILAAAGNAHCPISDFARFGSHALAAAQGNDRLLKPATFKRSQEILGRESFSDGVDFGGAPWLSAGMMISASKNLALVATVNAGDAQQACLAAFKAIEQTI